MGDNFSVPFILSWCRLNELSSVLVSFNITVEETEGILKVSETEQERIYKSINISFYKFSLFLHLHVVEIIASDKKPSKNKS